MNDQRPKTEQPKEQKAPGAVFVPNKPAVPTKPSGASPQPKSPDSGGSSSHTVDTCGCGGGSHSTHDHPEHAGKEKDQSMRTGLIAIALALLLPLAAAASAGLTKKDNATLHDSIAVLNAMANAPDKGIPQELLGKADCILIFPSVTKGAFIVGGKGGHGVASCRQPDGRMGSIAFYTVGGASVGFQIGGQSADVVMLIMNETGVNHLLSDKFTIGGEATATAGPVGRTVQAATDAQLHAQILSWSRSRGLFVGAALDGSVVKPNQDANARLYGQVTSGKEILVDSKLAVPASARPLVEDIRRHMAAAVAQEQADMR
jgi:lipid-binding SYLF domain-containing protein